MSLPRTSAPAAAAGARKGTPPWLPYVAPMAGFLALTAAENLLPRAGEGVAAVPYLVLYAAKLAVVSLLAWLSRSTWRDLRPFPGTAWIAGSVVSGLVVTVLWVALDGRVPPLPLTDGRSAFDPGGLSPSLRPLFLALRLYGLVLLVPLIEELFWRSFLLRWILRPDFHRVPVGRVTPLAALVTSALFAVAHPEWLPALLAGLLWAGLLARSGSLATCWIGHLAANLALGIWILATQSWHLW